MKGRRQNSLPLYMYLLSSKLPSHPGQYITLSSVLCTIQLVIHFKYISVNMLVSNSLEIVILSEVRQS